MINIYTDGSCINNGKKNSSGAIGVFYSDNDSRNIAKVINEGKITNQTMELLACINAL
jgi:ribonuclease HI